MSTTPSVQELNQELARRINEEALRDPKSPYFDKFVGIVDGQVVMVAESLDEVDARLRAMPIEPERTFVIQAGFDYDTPDEIWAEW